MILHCMSKNKWDIIKNQDYWGENEIKKDGFVHFSTLENFHLVAPNFKDSKEELILVCYDEDKLVSEVKFEDLENCGTLYPHVYSLINNDALLEVIPFSRYEKKNPN